MGAVRYATWILVLAACAHSPDGSRSGAQDAPLVQISVVHAVTGAPIDGAVVSFESFEERPRRSGPPRLTECQVMGGTPVASVRKSTAADGRAGFTTEDLAPLNRPPSRCPPGAVCVTPPSIGTWMSVARSGFLSVDNPFDGSVQVRLVPAVAAVRSDTEALSVFDAGSRAGAWFQQAPSRQAYACLTIEGNWMVVATAPYSPEVHATVDPMSSAVATLACPQSESPVRVRMDGAATTVLTDVVTGHEYSCAADVSHPCLQGTIRPVTCDDVGCKGVTSIADYGAPRACGVVGAPVRFAFLEQRVPSGKLCVLDNCKRSK